MVILFVITNALHAQTFQKTIKRLPDTGQFKSYTTTFGEDHDYSINTPFLINFGNGIIHDTVTSLIWQQSDGGEMTIENARIYVDSLTLGGYTDWRLPSALEAYSILNHQNSNPALDVTYFRKNDAEYWWTGDVQKNDPNKIWVTNAGGGIGNHLKTETISAGGNKKFHVRAVRNNMPEETITGRFEKKENTVVFDRLTSLYWATLPDTGPGSWENAIAHADSSGISGYDDWRLPNIKELQSLQDVRLIQPCIDKTFFPDIGLKKYWSSTSLPNQTAKAWYMDTHYGITSHDEKTMQNYFILVRGGTELISSSDNLSNNSTPTFIKVFPNPVHDFLRLDSQQLYQRAEIYNLAGQVFLINEFDNSYLNVSHLKPGFYLLKLTGFGKTGYAKFIKL